MASGEMDPCKGPSSDDGSEVQPKLEDRRMGHGNVYKTLLRRLILFIFQHRNITCTVLAGSQSPCNLASELTHTSSLWPGLILHHM